jgi:hypothetical protein
MDNTYGIHATNDLTLVNYRAALTGIQHRHDIKPLDPKPGEAVTIKVKTPGAAAFEQVALYYTTDGSMPAGSRGIAQHGHAIQFDRAQIEWDSLIWGYVIHWQAVIPGQPDQTVVQYVISAWSESGEEIYADWPDIDDQVHHAVAIHYKNIPADSELVHTDHFPGQRVFNYHVDKLQTPEWAKDAIIYQIFIDRFYPGDGLDWVQTEDTMAVCGGTLWGVRDKLDYLTELGINCIWLSPTWASPTHHGYDVTDYDRVEPRLGGEEALRAVIEGAHERGIRVLLDMVCNHLSNQHPFFLAAQNDENSAYRDWFMFDGRVRNGYKSFFGVVEMPRINLAFPPAREWMVANAVRWIQDFDVDGYRLDVADGPGPNFWTYFRQACKTAKPDSVIFGEIIDTPHRLRTYAGRLDGNLDFPLNDALRRTYAWETMTKVQMQALLEQNAAYYPDDFLGPVFLDNHDMNRFSFASGNDTEKLKEAVALQMQLPNPAIIYYGTEVGMQQQVDLHDSNKGYGVAREVMIWGDQQDLDLLAYYQEQIQARKERASVPAKQTV